MSEPIHGGVENRRKRLGFLLFAAVFGVAIVVALVVLVHWRAGGRVEEVASTPTRATAPSTAEVAPVPNKAPELPEERFSVRLEEGEFLSVLIDQRGVDLALFLEDPRGRRRLEIDSPNGDHGREWLDWIAEEAGEHVVILRRLRGEGPYVMLRLERGRPGRRHQIRARATRETAAGIAAWRSGSPIAENHFAAAAKLWQQVPDAVTELLTNSQRWAAAAERNAHYADALAILDRARKLARRLGSAYLEADLANTRAVLFNRLDDFASCREESVSAQALARLAHHEVALAVAAGNLGLCFQGMGDFQAAFSHYDDSLQRWQALGRPRSKAIVLHNLGTLLNATARWPEARDAFRDSLASIDPVSHERTVAAARTGLALALYQLGEEGWSAELVAALAIQRRLQDRHGMVRTLDRMANLATEQGHFDEAEAHFAETFSIYHQLSDPVGLAYSRANRAYMENRRGRPGAALLDLSAALPVLRLYEDKSGEAFVLLSRAEAYSRLNRLDEALRDAGLAIAMIEQQRARVPEPIGRMIYLDPRLWFFDTYLDVAMRLHAHDPAVGHDREALAITERARGRGLLDLLNARHRDKKAVAVDFGPRPLAELLRLREADTLFLVYYFSRERAYLWSLGSEGARSFDLGEALPIEAQIRDTYARLAGLANPRKLNEVLADLSRRLLPPTALQAGARRLVVVGDGAIRYVPFAALTDPTGQPLVTFFELSSATSLSVLAALRSVNERESTPNHLLAVVADPLGQATPPRAGLLFRALERFGFGRLPRLPHSRIEAQKLLQKVIPAERLALLGPSANRHVVLSGLLEPFRFVHFATHSLYDPEDVELSGLVLSQQDLAGQPIEPFLSFADLEKTRFTADLVVASACSTAMGRNLRGEGPVGISQAFLASGARRSLGSLWAVEDESTALFMAEFYHYLLDEQLPPAAALRQAQLRFLKSNPAVRPNTWAAFVLVGDYR
jgi:CHAT domain-containing protein/tetratricopeptide (TPR) repeat protein